MENNGSGGIHSVWSVKNTGSGEKQRVWSVKNTGSDGKQWVRWNTQRLVSAKHSVW